MRLLRVHAVTKKAPAAYICDTPFPRSPTCYKGALRLGRRKHTFSSARCGRKRDSEDNPMILSGQYGKEQPGEPTRER